MRALFGRLPPPGLEEQWAVSVTTAHVENSPVSFGALDLMSTD